MQFAEPIAWYGVLTGSASLVGLGIAFLQIRDASSRAKTALATAERVESQLQSKSVLYELSTCVQAVSDARNYLRLGLPQSGLLRIEGLASKLSSIRRLPWFDDAARQQPLTKTVLYNVALVRTGLDQHVCSGNNVIPTDDLKGWMKRLAVVEDQLNEWVGELRYSREATNE